MYKVVSINNDQFELHRGTYSQCNDWAMAYFNMHGYMKIIPV